MPLNSSGALHFTRPPMQTAAFTKTPQKVKKLRLIGPHVAATNEERYLSSSASRVVHNLLLLATMTLSHLARHCYRV